MHIDDFVQLLRAAQAGSTEAMGKLFEAVRARLHRVATHRIQRDLLAKNSPSDLVQDTLLEAYRSIRQFRGHSDDEFEAWLTRILCNNVSNFRRAYRAGGKRELKRELPLSSSDKALTQNSGPDDRLARDERVARMQRALAMLPSQERRVLTMRFWEKQSFESIGEREHRSADAVRKLCTRAMKKLAKKLDSRSAS